jgi:hypothetical protein
LKANLKEAKRRDGHYLLRTNLVAEEPAGDRATSTRSGSSAAAAPRISAAARKKCDHDMRFHNWPRLLTNVN